MFKMKNNHGSYAQSVGAKHFQTSAKLNKGVEELFFDLTKGIRKVLVLSDRALHIDSRNETI